MTERTTGDREITPRHSTPPLTRGHPMLAVADLGLAIAHYREVLGFYLEWARYDDDTGSHRGIANLWRGELSLFLTTHTNRGPSCTYCHLATRADVDALHVDLHDAGAKVSEAPTEQPWGNYEMVFEDLDDNRFRTATASSATCSRTTTRSRGGDR